MAKSNDLITRIKLMGHVDPSLQKAFDAANKQAKGSIQNLEKYVDKAKTLAKVTAGAITAAGAASVKAAIDYESAFAGVKKTVDETDTTKYEDISKGIRDMAKEMPTAASAIAEVAETAGQLGISADNIVNFSKVMVQLGETTNLSSEEAASSIAKLFNITGTNMDLVENFGSTIVALGNNAATTESDILNMATRIASSAKQIGLTEQQILALSTSMSSVGINAELGGTAISTTMTSIDKAVSLNSKTLSTWAKLSGMSASKFKQAWKKDAYGSLMKVIEGMGKAREGGQNLNVILEELGINNSGEADTLKRLSSNYGLLADMTEIANSAWEENIALSNEANTRYQTMASKIAILRNKLTDAGITIGTHLLPYLDMLIEKIDSIDFDKVATDITKFIDFCIEHQKAIVALITAIGVAWTTFKIAGVVKDVKELVEAFKPAVKLAGELSKTGKGGGFLGTFVNMASKLKGINIAALTTTLSNVALWIGTKIPLALNILRGALAFLTGPIGITIAIISLLVGAFIYLWKNCDGFRNFWINLWNDIVAFCEPYVEKIKNFFTTTLPEAINKAIEWFKTLPDKMSEWFDKAVVKTGQFVDGVVEWFKSLPDKTWTWVVKTTEKVSQWGSDLWNKAKEIGSLFVDTIINFFKTLPRNIGYVLGALLGIILSAVVKISRYAFDIGFNFLTTVIKFFAELPQNIMNFLVEAFDFIVTWGAKLWDKAVEIGSNFVQGLIDFFVTLPQKIWNILVSAYNFIVTWGSWLFNKAIEIGSKFVNGIINFIMNLPSMIWNFLVSAYNFVVTWGSWLFNKAIEIGSKFVSSVVNFFATLPQKIWNFLVQVVTSVYNWGVDLVAKGLEAAKNLVDIIVTTVQELPEKMLEIGANIVKGLWDGISSVKEWLWEKIKEFCGGFADGFLDFFDIHSPSRFMANIGQYIGQGLGVGLEKTQSFVSKSVDKVNNVVAKGFNAVAPVINPIVGKIPSIAQKTTNIPKYADGGTVTTPHTAIVGDAPETIVPHGNTPRNRQLLSEAAKGVGADLGNNTTVNITFAPVINGGNAEENRKMLQEEEEEFERKMDAYFAKKGRLAF